MRHSIERTGVPTIFPLIEAGSLIEAGGGLRANTLPDW